MVSEADLNILVSNVLTEKCYSHCRLCLKNILNDYVRYDDCVFVDPENETFQPLSEVVTTMLDAEVSEEISGIDAVCTECVNQTLQTCRFLKMCRDSTKLLHKIFDNLYSTLNIDDEVIGKGQNMYLFVEENNSRIVLIEKKAEEQFICQECNEVFDSNIELSVHNISEHGNTNDYQYEEETELDSKEEEKSGNKLKCYTYKQYKKKLHRNKYICKDCGKCCIGRDNLRAHESRHTSKSTCPKCGKTYITRNFYINHVKLCLEDQIDPHPYRSKAEKTFFCEKCGKGYSTSGGLRVHDRFVHGNAKPHICEQCGKSFTAPSYLKTHMVKHTGEKNFQCDLCQNRFVSKEALLYHKRRHTGDKPYSCNLCSERFVNSSARAEHIKFKHAPPSLTCDICSRKFYTANFLRHHIGRHHDPTSKLYSGRSMIPPNMPGEQNMRFKIEEE